MIVNIVSFIAQATAPTTSATSRPTPPGWMDALGNPMFILALGMMVFLFMMSRSKKSQEKSRKDLLANLKKGDRIQTIGGILGTVIEARADRVQVKIDENTNAKMWFVRSAIARVVSDDDAAKDKVDPK